MKAHSIPRPHTMSTLGALLSLAVLTVPFLGCGPSGTPVEQADQLLRRGEFEKVLEMTVAEASKTADPLEQAELWKINGRAYKDLIAFTPQEREAELAKKAIASLTKSIDLVKSVKGEDEELNADAYHLRMMMHERLGNTDEAYADSVLFRKFDVNAKTAYINEPKQEPLYEVERDVTSEEATADAAQAKRNQVSDADDRISADDEEDERDRSENESDSSRTTSTARSTESAPDDAGARRPYGLTDHDPDEKQDNKPKRDKTDEEFVDEKKVEPPPRTGAPGSTWQPWYTGQPEATESGRLIPELPTGPPGTGIVGPSWQGGDGQYDEYELPSAPTTGIAGPTRRQPSYPSGSSGATTGIGGAPVMTGPPGASGLPGQWSPSTPDFGSPQLPFTGSLPMTARPQSFARGSVANLPMTGPNYNPLRPSPLTQPSGTFQGITPNGILPPTARSPQSSTAQPPLGGGLPPGAVSPYAPPAQPRATSAKPYAQ
ncbi:MAG: hypothetical protein KDB23_28955 [Planctomycetales bacterium]|nr:hypothetical protein [Planctomycetales bacterium]